MNNSEILASRDWQSANLLLNPKDSSGDLRRTISRARFAAIRARAAIKDLSKINFAACGFSIKKRSNPSENTLSAIRRTSLLPSFVFVCPSNCGSGCFAEIIAVNPSRISSPIKASSPFNKFAFLA